MDDVADACIFLMENYNESHIINIGAGNDVSIAELANLIKDTIRYTGEIKFDSTKPDGMPRKALDNSRIATMGWKSKISVKQGLDFTYNWFLEHYGK